MYLLEADLQNPEGLDLQNPEIEGDASPRIH